MKKIVLFFVIFIICLSNCSEAISVRKMCNNCNRVTQCTYKQADSQNHILTCDICGSQVYINDQIQNKQEKHIFLGENGTCSKCGYVAKICTHEGTIRRYVPNADKTTHRVICENCNTVINEKEECKPNQSECEKCGVKKSATFDIPTKVYYIDENGLKDVNSMESITQIGINLQNAKSVPYFYWTMSTMGSMQYNSTSNNSYLSAASDGTIRFWYNGSGFSAELEKAPKNLSGEVVIKMTMKVDDVESTQTIRIIKSGIPKSNCTIYFKNNRIAIDGNELYLLIKTNYNDFSDDEVRKIREESPNEFPFYTIQNEKIELLESLDENILEIRNCEIKEVTNGYINGYWAKVKVKPKELGKAKVHYKLVMEYKYMNHEPKLDTREGTFFIDVVEKVAENEGNWDGNKTATVVSTNTTKPTGGSNINNRENTDDNEENNRKTSSSGGLAMVGVIGLLIVAFIGSKMLNHR